MQTANDNLHKSSNHVLRHAIMHCSIVFFGFSLLYIAFFAPVLFSGRLLAPGDGLIYYVPAFYAPTPLWTDLIFGGYPLMGDSQNMTWYPPAMLLSLIPGSWNAFVLLAYILAGCFAYCYTYRLTTSRLAAIVAGIIYSMSGFMMSHLGHITMIHAAAWMPLFICALEQLRHQFSRWWWLIGAWAVACCCLGGHPQMAVYSLGLGGCYTLFLGWRSVVGRWRYYRWIIGMVMTGLGLCAIQIAPTIELSQLSLRATMTFEDFASFSLPTWEAPQLLFPYIFGSHFEPPFNFYSVPRWGEWFITETTGYIGFLPLLLGVIGVIVQWRRGVVRFWFCVGLLAFLLAFGGDTWLGHVFYRVPIYNKFRAQARHFVEVAFAVSVLAGFGVAAVQRRLASKRLVRQTLWFSLVLVLFTVLSLAIFQPYFQAKAAQAGIAQISLLPWKNRAVALPLVGFSLAWLALGLWRRWPRSRRVTLVLLTVLILDLASFGWLWEWQVDSPAASALVPSSLVRKYRALLQATDQRMFSQYEKSASVFPNLTRLWELPNVGGYTPLILQRVSEMMRMATNGSVQQLPISRDDRTFDLMAVKYLIEPNPAVAQPLAAAQTDLGLVFGSGTCATSAAQTSRQIDLPDLGDAVTAIELVTTMGCAPPIPDNTELLKLQLVDRQGRIENQQLLAGRDTAESAYNCPDVQPLMQHQRAQIFRSSPIVRPDGRQCQAHQYVSILKLDQPQKLRTLKLQWTGQQSVLYVHRIRLIQPQKPTAIALSPMLLSPRWQQVDVSADGVVYANQQALPRTWLVSEALQLPTAAMLTAIQTSQLPDGRRYDPATIALVEDASAQFRGVTRQSDDRAEILSRQSGQIMIQTKTAAPAFLVLSDVFYPGWVATIDGQRSPIFPTNYIQRGVPVPAGEHVIKFRFEPVSFKLGAGVTMGSFLGGCAWLLRLPSGDDRE